MKRRGPTWALVPANDFTRAKSRLSDVLSPGERAELARRMLEHVLGVLRGHAAVDGVVVLTPSDDVAQLARSLGVLARLDTPGRGFGGLIGDALRLVEGCGATTGLVVMSDLPLLAGDDIDALLDSLRGHDAAIAPDRHDGGTNAIAIAPPGRMSTAFGHADSFARHRAQAELAAARFSVVRRPGLALDVDHPEDWDEARRRLRGGSGSQARA